MTSDLTKVVEESAKGGFFLITGALISTVISAIASIFIARFLGAELYGQYTLSLVVAQMLFLFTDFGISQGLVKFAACLRAEGKNTQVAKIIKYGMLLRALIGLIISIVNFAFAEFFATVFLNRPELAFYLKIASFSILFQVVFSTASSAYVGLDKTEYSALTTNVQATSKAIVSIVLVLAGFGIVGAVTSYVVGYIIGGIIGIAILLNMLQKSAKGNDESMNFGQSFKILMHYGMPLYVSVLLVGFIPPYQNLILGLFTEDVAIGNYKAAVNFITLITLVSIPITTALLPAFSKLNSTTNDKVKTFFFFANKYTTMLIIPIVMIIMIFSKEIVQIIYGSTYQTAALFLSVYCLLYFLVGIGYLTLASMFNGMGETKITLKISLITFAILVPLSPFLANFYGVIGIIIALIVAHTSGTLYGMYVAKRNFEITFDTKALIKIYITAAVSTILPIILLQISPLPKLFNVITGGVLYFVVYITLAPLTGIVNKTEMQTISQVAKKIKPLAPIIKPLLKYQEKILLLNK